MSNLAQNASKDATAAAKKVGNNPVVRTLARFSYVADGLIHLLVGYLAIQIALGTSATADQGGAFEQLKKEPWGTPLLWVIFVGCVAMALWSLTEVLVQKEIKDKVMAVVGGVGAALVASAVMTVIQSKPHKSGAQSSQGSTQSLLDMPFGKFLVMAVGIAVIAFGGFLVYKGIKKVFMEQLLSAPGFAEKIGMLGHIAKGIAMAALGFLFLTAGFTDTAKGNTGLDGALRKLTELPFGKFVLIAVGAGLALYGLYGFIKARWGKLGA